MNIIREKHFTRVLFINVYTIRRLNRDASHSHANIVEGGVYLPVPLALGRPCHERENSRGKPGGACGCAFSSVHNKKFWIKFRQKLIFKKKMQCSIVRSPSENYTINIKTLNTPIFFLILDSCIKIYNCTRKLCFFIQRITTGKCVHSYNSCTYLYWYIVIMVICARSWALQHQKVDRYSTLSMKHGRLMYAPWVSRLLNARLRLMARWIRPEIWKFMTDKGKSHNYLRQWQGHGKSMTRNIIIIQLS